MNKKIIGMLVIILMICLIPVGASENWWNTNYQYRINSILSDVPQGGYVYNLTVYSNSGTNNNTDVFLNSNAQSDFDDMRFTLDNTTELSYWIKDNTSDPCKVFINITESGTINLYYGHSGANIGMNGTSTYFLFDELYDSSPWTITGDNPGKISVGDGELSWADLTKDEDTRAYRSGFPTDIANYSIEIDAINQTARTAYSNSKAPGAASGTGIFATSSNYTGMLGWSGGENIHAWTYGTELKAVSITDGSLTINTPYWITMSKFNDTIDLSVYYDSERTNYTLGTPKNISNYTLVGATTGPYFIGISGYVTGQQYPHDGHFTGIRVRKYILPEPSWSTFSAEEEQTPSIPAISNLTNTEPGAHNVTITWDTNVSSDSIVKYSKNDDLTGYIWTEWSNDTTSVSIGIYELDVGDTYYYQAWSYHTTNNSFVNQSPASAPFESFTAAIINQSPHAPVLNYPGNGSSDIELNPLLNVTVSDPDADIMDVSFYNGTGANFTMIVLPDTQKYTQDINPRDIFSNQTQWIVDNKDDMNIVMVMHEGDIVEGFDNAVHFQRANRSMSVLDGVVPWGVLPGNHEMNYTTWTSDLYNSTFPASRFTDYDWYGGSFTSANRNNYQLISAGGDDYIIIHLEFAPTDVAVNWVNATLQTYSNRKAIIVTHAYFGDNGVPFSRDYMDAYRQGAENGGSEIYSKLVYPNDNVFMVLCGHAPITALNTTTIGSRDVHQMLADYQNLENGGNGYLRIFKFVPNDDKIYVRTYATYLQEYNTSAANQFTLNFPMTGTSALLGTDTSVSNNTEATYEWTGLSETTTYYWHTITTDSNGLEKTSPFWSFITLISDTYIPPDPTNLQNTTDNFWVNYTWEAGSGNVTDGYNVSVNESWYNTTNIFYNCSGMDSHGWSNISVWAYNSSGNNTLSDNPVSDNVQLANNPIAITNTSDWSGLEGEQVYLDFDYTDIDGDTPTFDTNATEGNLNTGTGVFTWSTGSTDAGTYYWLFNVTDGYGSTDEYVATIIVNDATPTSPSNIQNTTGNFWINWTWTKGSNSDFTEVKINNSWVENSTDNIYNNTYAAHATKEVSLREYNSTSKNYSTYLNQTTTIPNNPITLAVTQVYNKNEGDTVSISDTSSSDLDSDTPIYSCNRTDLFEDFNTATGYGNWVTDHADAGIYYVDIGVSDGYGSTDNKTLTITISDVPLIPPDPVNLDYSLSISWVNYTWQAGSGFKTDSFNVSINDSWYNGSAQTWRNTSGLAEGTWVNITVWAYNSTGGSLSTGFVSDQRQTILIYISTDDATDVLKNKVTMHGELHNMTDKSYIEVWFEWGLSSGGFIGKTDNQNLTSLKTFSNIVKSSAFIAGQTYKYRAVGDFDGTYRKGDIETFTFLSLNKTETEDFGKYSDELDYTNITIRNLGESIESVFIDAVGNIFWAFVFSLVFIGIWLRHEDTTIPGVLGLLIGTSIWAVLPPDWVGIAYSLIVVSFAGLVFGLLKSRR